MITADRLHEVLCYEYVTGAFWWKQPRCGVVPGDPAGHLNKRGYLEIRVDGVLYRAARLAFLWMTGEWPVAEVDHRDSDRSNNSWSNLREANRSQNLANRRYENSTGFRGVYLHCKTGLYRAEVSVNKKRVSLGYFKTPEMAHQAYVAAAGKHYGEFARAS